MKKWIVSFTYFIVLLFLFPALTLAQTPTESNNHTASEEAKGKVIQERLLNKEVSCQDLSEGDFASLGEYYMGQMMENMMGKEGEEQMHVVMGKRLSGCEPNAQIPSTGVGFMPMMWMMRGGENPMMGPGWGMMDGWGVFNVFGWLTMILFWILLILGVVALVRYFAKSGSSKEDKNSLDILKERYARGEINKQEFEEKKKDLS